MNNQFSLGSNLSNLFVLNGMKSRAICAENPTGEPGKGCMAVPDEKSAARELGVGWKVRPCVTVKGGETIVLADYTGESGMIQHIWMTPTGRYRDLILRFYWDGSNVPAIECPIGDFFANGWQAYSQISSLAVCLNPGSGLNCYWQMPFQKAFRITAENRAPDDMVLFYQIDYALCAVPENIGYFRACFRRSNPVKDGLHVILDGVQGTGRYVGTYLAWQVNNAGWWGEGEVKFYLDGDRDYPTIATTGTEDYFGGSYNFDSDRAYRPFTTPYTGLQVIKPDGLYASQMRFGLYRWHITDPICFNQDIRVDVQDLGWRSEVRYLKQKSDISSVAFWYEASPIGVLKPLPDRNVLEII
ncbi:MAG: DUF2961 domain-containing protein [Clostridiales bacterium]|jgi:hypothetical protein|nr:DUF2961 domain-containing protein [Clostridiales bacterium]